MEYFNISSITFSSMSSPTYYGEAYLQDFTIYVLSNERLHIGINQVSFMSDALRVRVVTSSS